MRRLLKTMRLWMERSGGARTGSRGSWCRQQLKRMGFIWEFRVFEGQNPKYILLTTALNLRAISYFLLSTYDGATLSRYSHMYGCLLVRVTHSTCIYSNPFKFRSNMNQPSQTCSSLVHVMSLWFQTLKNVILWIFVSHFITV